MLKRLMLYGLFVILILVPSLCLAKTVYVTTTGLDTNNGLTWSTAKKTVQAGMNTAVSSDEVWVASGTYIERITLKAGIALYGGFTGVETLRDQRDIKTNETILDGNHGGSVVTSPTGLTSSARIDGFTIRNGTGTLNNPNCYGGGIFCYHSSPTIANNTISGNSSYSGGGVYCEDSAPLITGNTITENIGSYDGGGIGGFSSSSPIIITGNLITRNSSFLGGGIYCSSYTSLTIINNTISGNHCEEGGGIYCGGTSTPTISGNKISENIADYTGGGIYCDDNSSPTITNDTITGNSAAASGGGILCDYTSSPTIINVTIVGNSAEGYGGGILYLSGSQPIVNSIIAFNSSGIYAVNNTLAFKSCCVYGNREYNYTGVTDPTGTNGNISVDPMLASPEFGNAHIQPTSPCKDAGDDTFIQTGWKDADGQLRIQGAHVDIGSDETDGTAQPIGPYAIIRVSPDGNDANDGSSWTNAKRTVQEAATTSILCGGEVWVKQGVYTENITLYSFAQIYGGFSGNETVRDQRNWKTAVTVLDGAALGSVITVAGGPYYGRIDGFIIRNGDNYDGGGIFCHNRTSTTIANNTITGNLAGCGGGIRCWSSPSTIIDNIISGNCASYGGGIYCHGDLSPTIINNTIVSNTTSGSLQNGGGVYSYFSSPTMINNIIAYNSSGVYAYDYNVTLKSCCVYGNQSYNFSNMTDPTGTNGNISVDPLLASKEYGNTHIQPNSPCRDTGNDTFAQAAWKDMDGQARIQGTHVDIGVDESDGTTYQPALYAIIKVSPDGNDVNDGLSWTNAKKTVQAAVDAAKISGGEVWVKQGTYNESITLYPYVYMYGGFAGNETDKSQRDWRTIKTVLIAVDEPGPCGSIISTAINVMQGYNISRIDGFVIKSKNTGISCRDSAPTIANNTITGGATGVATNSCPVIINNIIAENAICGIYALDGAPVIINNTVVNNGNAMTPDKAAIYDGGGAIVCRSTNATIANTIIAFNYADITPFGFDRPRVYSSCIYGNKINNFFQMGLFVDPAFISKASSDYRLSPISPCIDAGDTSLVKSGWTDVEGENRINGARVDIGADECYYTTSQIKPVSFDDIKKEADHSFVDIASVPTTAKFDGCFYVEDSNRSSGLRVTSSFTWSRGYPNLHITGVMLTNPDGERYLNAWAVSNAGGEPPIKPLSLVNQVLGGGDIFYNSSTGAGQMGVTGGVGLNNIGLMVTTWGHFTYVDSQTFTVDDGSGVNIKCVVPSGVTLNQSWQDVIVTGISSCEKVGDEIHRLIRVRTLGGGIIGY